MAGRRGPGGPMGGQYLTEEEKKAQPKVTKALLLRVFSYIAPYWKQMIVVLAAGTCRCWSGSLCSRSWSLSVQTSSGCSRAT